MSNLIRFAVCFCAAVLFAAGPEVLRLEGDVEGVHDPAIIKQKETYYVFSTGGGRGGSGIIPIRTSKDLTHWTSAGNALPEIPEWGQKEIPGARGAWAPDISFYRGKYHLYYALSTFGSRNSAIGLATNVTLDAADPNYKWVDQGMVLRSFQEKDDWNAIDANLVIEGPDSVWLDWGSFWGGIKMRRLDPATGKLSDKDTTMYSLCSRPREQPIGGSVEAPFLVKHADYWYLFVSYDRCCRGANSTYNVVVGRAKQITGPYMDRNGKPMTEGGGTQVIAAATPNWRGPGHEAVLQLPGQDYLAFHAYHGTTGRSSLFISTMTWEDGWPHVGTLP
jgi:arabinan endo-1,5-alpha-L-arabinosidase